MPSKDALPENVRDLVYRQAAVIDTQIDFNPDMERLIRQIGQLVGEPDVALPARRWIWAVAAISGLLLISLGAMSYYVWRSPLASATVYSKAGNFACFDQAKYPDSWREEATLCTAYGCNFGKMSQDDCLTLGARKQSKTVIHGNVGSARANECWLQQSCGDLRPHSEFTLFRM